MHISSIVFYLAFIILFLGVIFQLFLVGPSRKACESYKIGDNADGKLVLITGANSGIGHYTSMALAKNGARVIMACRSIKRCDEAKEQILTRLREKTPSIETMQLDLASEASIRAFALKFVEKYGDSGLDVLVNNAGIMVSVIVV